MMQFGFNSKTRRSQAATKTILKGTASRRVAERAEMKKIGDLLSRCFSACSALSARKKSSRRCVNLTDCSARAWGGKPQPNFHHEDHEDHEVLKKPNRSVLLRPLRGLRGE
jgi:hypothetical protein